MERRTGDGVRTVRRERLAPSFFLSSLDCLKAAKDRTDSVMLDLNTFLMSSSDSSALEPKDAGRDVSVSLVCARPPPHCLVRHA